MEVFFKNFFSPPRRASLPKFHKERNSTVSFREMFAERVGACTDSEISAFEMLYGVLTEYNEKFNLTAIRTPEDYLSKHVADCVSAARFIRPIIPHGGMILDVGSGAGFPALPLAVMLPDIKVTALDSTAKKLVYIGEAAARIGCTNVSTVTGRAEEVVFGRRESFDVVTARAVARLNILIELCAPFVAVGGYFVAMKGALAAEEAAEAENAARLLGLAPAEITPYSLPCLEDSRAFVCYRKVSPTPDRYPRQYSKIVKKPL